MCRLGGELSAPAFGGLDDRLDVTGATFHSRDRDKYRIECGGDELCECGLATSWWPPK